MDIKTKIKDNQKVLHGLFSKNEELALIKEEFLKYIKKKIDLKNRPVIAAAHQPIFYYPGIILKNSFLSETAEKTGGIPVNIIVDSDKARISIPVPYKKEDHYVYRSVKIDNPDEEPFVSFSPDRENVQIFFRKISESIRSLDNEKIKKVFFDFKERFFELFNRSHDFIDTVISLRREYEKSNNIKVTDFKLSEITTSPAFFRFVWYIVKNIKDFLKIYNSAVEKNKKGKYQTVKLLLLDKNIYELPFWFMSGSARNSIYLKKENNIFSFFTEGRTLIISIDIENTKEKEIIDLLKEKLILFPKALILTLMTRIFLCDIFIHGTGGAFYDRITNEIIREFFNLTSFPEYLTVTGDIYLPLINEDISRVDKKYNKKKKWLEDISHHSTKYMDKKNALKYLQKKKKISLELSEEKDAQKRKDIHKRLKKIDQQMKAHFKGSIQLVKKELSQYEYILKSREALFNREYPYFFYPELL